MGKRPFRIPTASKAAPAVEEPPIEVTPEPQPPRPPTSTKRPLRRESNNSKDHPVGKGPNIRLRLPLILVAAIVVAWRILHGVPTMISSSLGKSSPPPPPRLGDGCLLVFLDLGSNIGVHSRFLLEPKLYPDATKAHSMFNRAFGPPKQRHPGDICTFSFEPNPIHRQRHMELQAAYRKMGWRYHYIAAAVGDHNGNMTFYHHVGDPLEAVKEEWGFSQLKLGNTDKPEIVPVIHLSEWIQYHIGDRKLPTVVHGVYDAVTRQRGRVLTKVDIEGSEFLVLPNLLLTGTFCKYLDVVFGEYHFDIAPRFNRLSKDPDGQGYVNIEDATVFFEWLGKFAQGLNPKDCRGRWILLDDESYINDGVPFPTPK